MRERGHVYSNPLYMVVEKVSRTGILSTSLFLFGLLFYLGKSRASVLRGAAGQVQKNESIVECHHGDASVTQDRNARYPHGSDEGLLRRVARVASVRHESRVVIP